MIDNLEQKITFEIPTLELFRANNYSFWQNLKQQHQNVAARAATMGNLGPSAGAESVLFGGGDYNSSDFDLLSTLQNIASQHGGSAGLSPDGSEQLLDPTYERFIGDVWVGIVLTLMILSSIFCMCSCFLYHKFRQWQRSVLTARSQTLSSMDLETPPPYDVESLPSYTIVSGLPSYNDAIEQLKQKQQQQYAGYEPVKVHRPSVIKLFESQSQDLGTAKLEEIRYNFASNRPTSVGVEGTVTELAAATTSSGNSEPTATTTVTAASTAAVPLRTAATTTTTSAVPSGKSVATQNANPAEFKKFNVSRYTLENERSNAGFSS